MSDKSYSFFYLQESERWSEQKKLYRLIKFYCHCYHSTVNSDVLPIDSSNCVCLWAHEPVFSLRLYHTSRVCVCETVEALKRN